MTASLISEGTFIIFNRLADNKKETGELGQNMYNKYQLFSLLKSHTLSSRVIRRENRQSMYLSSLMGCKGILTSQF